MKEHIGGNIFLKFYQNCIFSNILTQLEHSTLSDFVICRKRYYNKSGRGLYLSFGTLWEGEIYNILSSDTNKQIFYVVMVE